MPSCDPRRIAAARLERQFLVGGSPHRSAADVVRALCAVQSQDFAGAKWALAMRSDGLDEAAIDAAFDRGDIVRTHVLRPTWHFVAPEDLRWMQALTGHRVERIMASYNVKLGLTPIVFRKSLHVIETALAEQGPLTRTELKVELERSRINTEGTQRLAHLMMQAEVEALVCSGPQRGKQSTYALVDERVTKSRILEGDEALHELTLRYFASRAPATAHDFSWWSGLTVAECTRGIAMAGTQLQHMTLNDKRYFVPPDFELPSKLTTGAHLLPNYDEYFIGFKDRSAIGQRLGHSGPVTGGNALIAHVVTIDGQLVGGWRRAYEKGKTVLRFELLVKLERAEHAGLKRAVNSFAEYTGSGAAIQQFHTQKTMKSPGRDKMIEVLKARFEKNMHRHKGIAWAAVQVKLEGNLKALKSLSAMEASGGEPDVIGTDKSGHITFCDCSAESPPGRRSLCFDKEALDSRKEHKPEGSAVQMAAEMGIELLTEKQYRELQQLGEFDLKTSNWIETPSDVRSLGGALFCDRRYGKVFVYHNGAQSYYAARGFRGRLRV